MANNDITIKNKSTKAYRTPWEYKEGVFKTPQGDFIARIKRKGNNVGRYHTISRHKTEEEAKRAYEEFYRNI